MKLMRVLTMGAVCLTWLLVAFALILRVRVYGLSITNFLGVVLMVIVGDICVGMLRRWFPPVA